MMRSNGTPAMASGFHSSIIDFGVMRFWLSTCASMSTTVSFANSAGCPSRCPATVSQPEVLVAVPAPDPKPARSATSMTMVSAYAGTVIHSIRRTDARLTANAPMMPTIVQMACSLYAPVAGVCTSVWPAEKTTANP